MLFYAQFRQELVCLIPYSLGLVGAMLMNTVSTCDASTYSGHDYRNNYSPPLHTQWDVSDSSACQQYATDWMNISNRYEWLEGVGGQSRCRVVRDFDRNVTEGTLLITTNDASLTEAAVSNAFTSASALFVSNETTTTIGSTSTTSLSTSTELNVTLSYTILPTISNTSNIGSSSEWLTAFVAATGVNTTTHTMAVTVNDDYLSGTVFYMVTEAECSNDRLVSDAQSKAYRIYGSRFPDERKVNAGFVYVAGPFEGRGYCAEDPGTCDIISLSDLIYQQSTSYSKTQFTIEKSAFKLIFFNALCVAFVYLLLFFRSFMWRRRGKHERKPW